MNNSHCIYRSTPVESLHTILLGVCKYMVRSLMSKRSALHKKEIHARMTAFPFCGFSNKLSTKFCYYYKSLVGRDIKVFMQMAVFIISPYLSNPEKQCWLNLSKVL